MNAILATVPGLRDRLRARARARRDRIPGEARGGFTLVELMVSTALTLAVMGFLMYIWLNTLRTIQRATDAVVIHNRGRYVVRMVNETLVNSSGCHVLIAGDHTTEGARYTADLAGIDSFKMVGYPKWHETTRYNSGNYVQPRPINDYVYKCIEKGETGSSQPDWPTSVGGTVWDGTVKWQCYEKDTDFGYARGCKWSPVHYDHDGNLEFDFNDTIPNYTTNKMEAHVSKYTTGKWKANKEVMVNQTALPTNLAGHQRKFVYRAVLHGRISTRDKTHPAVYTGSTEPEWPQQYGGLVDDGGVSWMAAPPYLCFIPINIRNGTMGKVCIQDMVGEYNGADTPRTTHLGDTTNGWAVQTRHRTCIYCENIAHFSVVTSATHDIDGSALGAPVGDNDPAVRGVLEVVDALDQGKFKGYRGLRPQGKGYRPRLPGDKQSETEPRQPRWVRVDFEIIGDVRPDIPAKDLARSSFTHIVLLR